MATDNTSDTPDQAPAAAAPGRTEPVVAFGDQAYNSTFHPEGRELLKTHTVPEVPQPSRGRVISGG